MLFTLYSFKVLNASGNMCITKIYNIVAHYIFIYINDCINSLECINNV